MRSPTIEDTLLAAILREPELAVRHELTEEHFTQPEAAAVFRVVKRYIDDGVVPETAIIIADCAEVSEYIERIAGIQPQNEFETYVEKSRELVVRRRLLEASRSLARAATLETTTSADDLASTARTVLSRVTTGAAPRTFLTRAEAIERLFDELSTGRERAVVNTGFIAIDRVLKGIEEKTLVVVAATPGTGKTALLESLVSNIACESEPCAVLSIETPVLRLVRRAVAAELGIPLDVLKGGELGESEYNSLANCLSRPSYRYIYYDDRSDVSESNIGYRIRHIVSETGARNVFIDYLQLIAGYSESRRLQIDGIVNACKDACKELGIRIFLVSQLNRAVRTQDGGATRPRMYHLKESGGIEQAADIIILLDRDGPAGERETRVYIDKNRDGATGECIIYFDPARVRFVDYLDDLETL